MIVSLEKQPSQSKVPTKPPNSAGKPNLHWPPSPRDADRVVEARRAVANALRTSSYGPLRSIAVAVNGHSLVLCGQVSSYYLKQLAQAEAQRVVGSVEVHNHLAVIYPE